MPYRPTEYPRVGKGRYYYISYLSLDRVRGGKKRWKPHVKKVYISGKLVAHRTGQVVKRSGRVVKGIEFSYVNTRRGYHRKGFAAQRNKTLYTVPPTRVKRSELIVRKVVELPSDAKNIKITTNKREVQPTLMDVR